MFNKKIMKKILINIFAIAAVAAAAGIGSWAMWSDTETSSGNQIVAGYLNLTMDPTTISIKNAYPGLSGDKVIDVTNDSTVRADLAVSAINMTDYENGCVEPERDVEESAEDCAGTVGSRNDGANKGELSKHVYVQFYISTDNGLNYEEVGPEITLEQLSHMETPIPVGTMDADSTYKIKMHWRVENSDEPTADNIYMTDAVVADITAILTQSPTQPTQPTQP